MATTIGTLTIKGNDLGNLPSYYDMYVLVSNNQFNAAGGGGLNPGTLTEVLDQYVTFIQSGGGTMTYSYNGPGVWNGGTDTIVTITISNFSTPEMIPYYLVFQTEDYTYAVIWQTSQPVTPTLCNDCQFIQLNQCGTDDFRLDLGLPDGSYTAFYYDNTSQIVYEQGTYSSQAQGGLSMYQWNATVGMFNPYSFYTLTIHDNNGAPVSWTVDGVEYTCATLTFKTTVNITD